MYRISLTSGKRTIVLQGGGTELHAVRFVVGVTSSTRSESGASILNDTLASLKPLLPPRTSPNDPKFSVARLHADVAPHIISTSDRDGKQRKAIREEAKLAAAAIPATWRRLRGEAAAAPHSAYSSSYVPCAAHVFDDGLLWACSLFSPKWTRKSSFNTLWAITIMRATEVLREIHPLFQHERGKACEVIETRWNTVGKASCYLASHRICLAQEVARILATDRKAIPLSKGTLSKIKERLVPLLRDSYFIVRTTLVAEFSYAVMRAHKFAPHQDQTALAFVESFRGMRAPEMLHYCLKLSLRLERMALDPGAHFPATMHYAFAHFDAAGIEDVKELCSNFVRRFSQYIFRKDPEGNFGPTLWRWTQPALIRAALLSQGPNGELPPSHVTVRKAAAATIKSQLPVSDAAMRTMCDVVATTGHVDAASERELVEQFCPVHVSNAISEEMVKAVGERAEHSHNDEGLSLVLRGGMREHTFPLSEGEIAAGRAAVRSADALRKEERDAARAAKVAAKSAARVAAAAALTAVRGAFDFLRDVDVSGG